ncbi:MAG: tetratricopeptide repeat protein [Promethearchaeota archaeon]|nr:MAG: tetratricopeptide repeat protein [Candidatus Lokiarchaeota archaeon]
MSLVEPKNLIHTQNLIENAQYKKALQIINSLIEKNELTLQEKVSWYLLKSKCLNRLGQFEEALEIAEELYKESQGFENPLQTLDILIEMAESLVFLGKLEKSTKIISNADILLKQIKNIPPKDTTTREGSLSYIKSGFYFQIGNVKKFMEYGEQSIKLQEQLGNKYELARSLLVNEHKAYFTGDWDKALEALKKSLELEGKSISFNVGRILRGFAIVYFQKGEIDYSLKYVKRSLKIFRIVNSKLGIADSLNHLGTMHRFKDEIDKAIEYYKQSLKLFEDLGNKMYIVQINSCLFELAIDMNEPKKAQLYLQRLKEYKDNNTYFGGLYSLSKALLLRLNPRAINRGKAEEIFKELVEKDDITHETKEIALVNLCDLLLIELRSIDQPELLEEFQFYITKLLDFSQKYNSYSLQANSFFLQAKLALIKLDLKEARKLLIQAQKLAEKHGLKRLAMKISNEHDEILKQLTVWENLKKTEASLKERLKLSRLNEQMEIMIRKRVIEELDLPDEEPVLLLIVSEGGTPIFSQTFVEDLSYEDHLFGGFFTAINSFIEDKFSEGLDRAIFGDHTLLMDSVSPFFMCYIFKGQSYSAQQKIRHFINGIRNNQIIWKVFNKFHQLNQEIQLKDIPSLENLIKEIFIEKSIEVNGLM